MGYRSDVKFVLHHEDPVTFEVLYAKLRADLRAIDAREADDGFAAGALGRFQVPTSDRRYDPFQRNPVVAMLNFEHVKWYGDYDDVKAIEAAVELWGETGSTRMVRLGEDDADMEIDDRDDTGGLSGLLNISRTIECNLEPIPDDELVQTN